MALPYEKVWTDEEVDTRNVVLAGNYPFVITTAEVKKTKESNKDMLAVAFDFWGEDGVVRKIKAWIVFDGVMDWQLRHLAKSIGKLDLYEAKKMDETHLVNARGVFAIGLKDNTYNGETKKQNYVKDYIFKDVDTGFAAPSNDGDINDDIPDSFA